MESVWNQRIAMYESHLQLEKMMAHNSILAYLRDVKKLQSFAENQLEVLSPESITLTDLQEFLYQQFKEKTSPRAQARWISGIKSFFHFLVEENLIPTSPALLLQAPKLGFYLPDTLSTNEIDSLLLQIERGSFIGERDYCILEVLYGCGLRVSEAIELKISSINFKENFVEVTGKGDKMRWVPLTDYTQKIIENYIKYYRSEIDIHPDFSDTLFLNARGKALSRVSVFTMIKALAVKAHLKKNISPHTFRHSYATHLLQNGADLRFIQEMLGHSSITTTEIYTHLETEELRETILHHHPRNQKI